MFCHLDTDTRIIFSAVLESKGWESSENHRYLLELCYDATFSLQPEPTGKGIDSFQVSIYISYIHTRYVSTGITPPERFPQGYPHWDSSYRDMQCRKYFLKLK